MPIDDTRKHKLGHRSRSLVLPATLLYHEILQLMYQFTISWWITKLAVYNGSGRLDILQQRRPFYTWQCQHFNIGMYTRIVYGIQTILHKHGSSRPITRCPPRGHQLIGRTVVFCHTFSSIHHHLKCLLWTMVLISLLVFSSLHHVTHVRTDAIPCPSHLSPTTADVATSCFPAFELPTRWGPVWAHHYRL